MVALGIVTGIEARRLARLGWGFLLALQQHPDLVEPATATAVVRLWLRPPWRPPDDLFQCCECGAWESVVAGWPGVSDCYGQDICMRDVRHAEGQRAARLAADEWDWHPVAIEAAQYQDHTLSVAPGDVCVSCFEVWDGVGVSGFAGW